MTAQATDDQVRQAVAAERERIAGGLQRLARAVLDADISDALALLDTLAAGQLPTLERQP